MEGFTKGPANDKLAADKLKADNSMDDKKMGKAVIKVAPKDAKKPMDDSKKPVAREGFNLIDRERVMQKGKRASDLIGVADTRKQSDDAVEPNDPSCFADQAAQF
jgi:hypothetical protein